MGILFPFHAFFPKEDIKKRDLLLQISLGVEYGVRTHDLRNHNPTL